MRRQGLCCRVEDGGATAERTAPRLRHPLRWYQGQAALLRFAQCMRSHGVANFPGPGSETSPKAGSLDPYSPQFQGAARDCKSFLAPVTGTGSG
jgi:hypothetical protein